MPAVSSVSINDGAATPVAHVFEPAKATADLVLYEDRDAGIYIGNKKLTMSITRPSGNGNVGNRNIKMHLKLEVPRLETVSNSTVSGIAPAPTIAYRQTAEVVFTFSERGTIQERIDLRVLLRNALANLQVTSSLDTLSIPY